MPWEVEEDEEEESEVCPLSLFTTDDTPSCRRQFTTHIKFKNSCSTWNYIQYYDPHEESAALLP